MDMNKKIIKALKSVIDPEIGISVYDLGFIYDIAVDDHNNVTIKMTLTTPGCPMMQLLLSQVECAVRSIKSINQVKIDLVFDPPWSPDRMSEQAKSKLGYK